MDYDMLTSIVSGIAMMIAFAFFFFSIVFGFISALSRRAECLSRARVSSQNKEAKHVQETADFEVNDGRQYRS
jgi:hypothetical protein